MEGGRERERGIDGGRVRYVEREKGGEKVGREI